MKKKKSNSKNKIYLMLAGIGVLILFLAVATFLQGRDFGTNNEQPVPATENNDEELDVDGYPEIDENYEDDDQVSELMPYISLNETVAILEDRSGEGFFIYVGRPTCPQCVRFQPTVLAVLEELGGSIAHFETDRLRATEQNYNVTVSELLALMEVRGTPTIAFIVDGVAVDHLAGNQSEENLRNFIDRNGGF